MKHLPTLIGALCWATGAFAADAPMAGSRHCQGEPANNKQVQALYRDVEHGDLFKFAAAQFGRPLSCALKFESGKGGTFSTLSYQFAKGRATFESLPPESAVITLEAGERFAKEDLVRAAFQRVQAVNQFRIDWQAKPEVSVDNSERMERYSTADKGTNAMVDYISRGGQLVRISFHYAL